MTAKTEPTYLSGELIRRGDIVRLAAWDAVVEDIITEDCDGWADYWRDTTGQGVMLVGPAFGRLFTNFHDEDLFFLRRQEG